MKNLLYALSALVMLSIASCEPNDPPAPTPTPVAPYVASCSFEVDSVAVTCDTLKGPAYAMYNSVSNSISLSFDHDTTIGVSLDINTGAVQGGEYVIKGQNFSPSDTAKGYFSGPNGGGQSSYCYIYPNIAGQFQDGKITITKLDLTNKRISGTFYFDACNNGVVYKIRKGTFTDYPLFVQ